MRWTGPPFNNASIFFTVPNASEVRRGQALMRAYGLLL
jgi:hypothetical protein